MIYYDPDRWFHHLLDVKGSLIVEIAWRVLACFLWSIGVVLFDHWAMRLGFSSTVHAIVGTALGFLVVFRTNSSYDRFWEGRQLWGKIVNETRNLARGARAHLRNDPILMEQVIRWTGAFPYAVKNVLRKTEGLGAIARELPEAEREWAARAEHPPLAIATRITSRLIEARDRGMISDITLAFLDQNVQLLVDYAGACERINSTPIPFAYMVHLRRVLILYCFTLPFALVDSLGWLSIFATVSVAYIFFGIEEIGVEIENPFGEDPNDLALEDLCAKIARNLLALIGRFEEADAHAGTAIDVIKIGVE